jgi:hypothetical protein
MLGFIVPFASLNIIQVLEHLHLFAGNEPARHF